MADVMNAYSISANGCVGLLFGEQVMQEIRHEVYEVLRRHESELVDYNWTLNQTYKEDGEQVIIRYPYESKFHDTGEELSKVLTSNSIVIQSGLFTTEGDRDKVAEICKAVAIGEIEPKGVMK